MPSHKPDSDPPEESGSSAAVGGVGPWVEHARVVLDGLRVVNRSVDITKRELRESVKELHALIDDNQERILTLEKKDIAEEARRVAKEEVTSQVTTQHKERISYWTMVWVSLGSGGLVVLMQWIGSLLFNHHP